MATKKMLAFDLGAESGRGILGLFDGQRLQLEVVHRFPNGPVRTLDTMHWDLLRLYSEMLATLRRCAAEKGGVDSLGVDTWGVDFGLLGRDGTLLGWMGGHGALPGQFILPTGIAVDKQNRVYVSEQFFDGRVQEFQYITDADAAAEKAKREGKQ